MSREEVEFTAYVRGDGRMTVPKEVRDALSIKEGDLVECRIRKIRRR
jgi:AbrB family looped-hinge helix DNA binding protein